MNQLDNPSVRSSCVAPDGVLVDLSEDGCAELAGPERHDWIRSLLPDLLFGSATIVGAATPDPPYYDCPGLYFLIWRERVCYVGQSGCVGSRLRQHYNERRPIDGVSVILGLPSWALTEIEYAYATAWDLPWNCERTRSGWPALMQEIAAAIGALDRGAVMPRYVPSVTPAQARGSWKEWQLQVHARMQAEAATPPAAEPI